MNWRTDKPTAKLIVADIAGSRYPEVLKLGSDCYYGAVNHLPVDYDSIEKWANLEEETLTADEQIVHDSHLKRIEDKRVIPALKGELKHKFENEFNTLYQTLSVGIFNRCLKDAFKKVCLSFVAWGVYNCKDVFKDSPSQYNKDLEEDETVTDCYQLEEEINRAIDDLEGVAEKDADGVLIAHLTLIEHLKDFARHFAKWGAEHRDRFLNWIRDIIKKGIEKPEEALNILKRIDALINDDSLWAEHLKK